jgi:polar amino acid transport system substrate-binding protein
LRLRPARLTSAVGIVAGLTIALLLFVLFRTSSSQDLSLSRVRQAGALTIGLDPSYPPFEVLNGVGQLDGFDVELANELGRRLGVRARLVSVDFGGIYDALDVGKLDLIVGGVTNAPDEDRRVSYTRPYFDDGLVLVSGSPSSGSMLGIESGSDADLDLATLRAKLADFTFRPFDDQEQIRAAIESHALRGAVVDRVTASLWARDSHELTVGRSNLTSVPYVIGGRRGDGELLHAVDHALQAMLADGFVASLEQKWLHA